MYTLEIQKGKRIILKANGKLFQIPVEKITFIECEAYTSTVHFIDESKPICVSRILKDFEKELIDFGFLRSNRSVLVNLCHINCINCNGKPHIILSTNKKIEVSRRRLPLIKKIFRN